MTIREIERVRVLVVDFLRGWPMLVLGLIGLAGVYWIAPDQLGNILNQQCKMFIAGYSAYWLDRLVFPNDRVDAPDPDKEASDRTSAQLRRAIIIAAALVMSGLNP